MSTSWRVRVRVQLGSLDLDVDFSGDDAPLALIGPNGSGKTTLLRCVAGALRPAQGEVSVKGMSLFSSDLGVDLPSEQRRIGYVPQGHGLFPHLRVVDNVAFGLSTGARRLPQAERRSAARQMLTELGCAELLERWPRGLSGGEQQRVALARALVIAPALLLLDEPLAALDAGVRRSVRIFLSDRLKTLGCPSIMVTHDVRDALALNARVCVLEAGRIIQQGSLSELQAAPASDFVAEFVGAAPITTAQ